jgi:predicted enzyme related to lactoylglutathione lyase/ketosteroid isomerase-like protein
MNKQLVYQFIDAVNEHNINAMGHLISPNHSFTDAHNNSITGKDKILAGWKAYFEWFPDYNIDVEKIVGEGDTLALFGFAQGTFHNLKQDNTKAHWHLPASWKVVVSYDKIDVWQVYADTKIPFEIIQRYTTLADGEKILGLGGVFFKSRDPKKLCAWYDRHLGTAFGKNQYSLFRWRDRENKEQVGSTTFALFGDNSDYFSPSTSRFMFNFRVHDLEKFLAKLKKEGVQVIDKIESYDYGKFGWIVDPEGNKIELWEPKNEELFDNQ